MDNNFAYSYQKRRRARKRKKLIRFLFFWTVFLVSVFIAVLPVVKNYLRGSVELISPYVPFKSLVDPALSKDKPLDNVVKGALEGTEGVYAVAIKNLKTGESYYSNENRIFKTGSLYKLWVMATVYQKIQNGELAKDQMLKGDIASLNAKFSIDPEDAELTEGPISLTVASALNQMITISHNYAALLLTEKIKLSQVAAFLKDKGFNLSTVGTNGDPPTSTVSDIASFLEKLYKGELASDQYAKEMIDLLKNQKLNDGLPKYLPDKSMIASKTGDIGWFKHDAGIVFSDKGDYIIVVMSESDSPTGAQERIALVSKAVYDYFSKN